MKKLLFAAFVAFWSSVATIVALEAMAPGMQTESDDKASALPEISLAQLAEHSTAEDCWMAIEGSVYDFSAFLPDHPSSQAVIVQWCGKEATEGMRTKGYGRDHSATAWAMMGHYEIGRLNEQ